MSDLLPICPLEMPCKCCGSAAAIFGVVDFHKHCEARRGRVLPFSGIPVYYHRCSRCGFIFTAAFDGFSKQDFLDRIYNDGYAFVDPDYTETRPVTNARVVAQMFASRPTISILDYGGGNGRLAAALRDAGFSDVQTYDPFVARHAARPRGRFDCVLCFEVLEHSTSPGHALADIDSLLAKDGLILFSTLLQPLDIQTLGVAWWYLAPRNGHVSLFTPAAFTAVLEPLGLKNGSFNANLHAAFRAVPVFAAHLVKA